MKLVCVPARLAERPRAGFFTLTSTPTTPEPAQTPSKRVVSFIDGQNLFHSVRESFGYDYPNYHPAALTQALCTLNGWQYQQTRFYTGVPKLPDSPYWHKFWAAKKRFMSRNRTVYVFTRDLHYRAKLIDFHLDRERLVMFDGTPMEKGTQLFLYSGKTVDGKFWVRTPEEKGIDVRIALDMVRMTHRQEFDVGIIFSQDQDQSETVSEIYEIAKSQGRWVELYSAFPVSRSTANKLPIRGTKAIEIDRHLYDANLDPNNYQRPQ